MSLERFYERLQYVEMLRIENEAGMIASFQSSRRRRLILLGLRISLLVTLAYVAALLIGGAVGATVRPDLLPLVRTGAWGVPPLGLVTVSAIWLFLGELMDIAEELGYAWDD